jgi:hypothetical protein
LSFERIKIPVGRSTVFELPGDDSEPTSVKEFTGVILITIRCSRITG